MKRVLAVLLAGVLALGMTMTAFAADSSEYDTLLTYLDEDEAEELAADEDAYAVALALASGDLSDLEDAETLDSMSYVDGVLYIYYTDSNGDTYYVTYTSGEGYSDPELVEDEEEDTDEDADEDEDSDDESTSAETGESTYVLYLIAAAALIGAAVSAKAKRA